MAADAKTLQKAVDRKAFARPARQQVTIPETMVSDVHDLLRRRCLDGLGLLNKAGGLTAGFTKVSDFLRAAEAVILIEASDGAADGRTKLLRLAHAVTDAVHGRLTVVGCFTESEIGLALGRESVVHAAGPETKMVRRWLTDVGRLAGFQPLTPADWELVRGTRSSESEIER